MTKTAPLDERIATAPADGALDRFVAHRDHPGEDKSGAWKASAAVNDNAPANPQYAMDDRSFDKLSDSDKARESMSQQMSDAWKA